jgi:DNA-binding transcriptional regulator GbsR (MarR family)
MGNEGFAMTENDELSRALDLVGLAAGDRQESRLKNLLSVILRLQKESSKPLAFSEIYEELLKEEQETQLTKAWVHRVLKSLVDTQLIRLESPNARRKRYIADVNTVMAGLEHLKAQRLHELEGKKVEIDKAVEEVTGLECGTLAQQFVREVTGSTQEISSRIVRGVDELHRVLRYNMLDVAKKGDIIRATLIWVGPFFGGAVERVQRFVETAMRGVDVRYMVTPDVLRADEIAQQSVDPEKAIQLIQGLKELRKKGVKFDFRAYVGPKTYFQVSLNNDNMALVITEDPMTATWITRDFNPDLIDNAVKAFDRDWKKARSILDMTPEDLFALGAQPGGLISKVLSSKEAK